MSHVLLHDLWPTAPSLCSVTDKIKINLPTRKKKTVVHVKSFFFNLLKLLSFVHWNKVSSGLKNKTRRVRLIFWHILFFMGTKWKDNIGMAGWSLKLHYKRARMCHNRVKFLLWNKEGQFISIQTCIGKINHVNKIHLLIHPRVSKEKKNTPNSPSSDSHLLMKDKNNKLQCNLWEIPGGLSSIFLF